MKRKIIKQGNSSCTITLPSQWIRKNGLEDAKEIEVTQTDDGLVIAGKSSKKHESVSIDVSGYSARSIENVLYQAYRKGHNKILLKNIGENDLKVARIAKNVLFGFDITESYRDRIEIENITEPASQKLGMILKKVFQLIKNESSEILEELSAGKYNPSIRLEARRTTDNYTNFCRRAIINDRVGGLKDSYLLYTFVSNLSLIAHGYFYLHYAASKHRIKPKKTTLRIFEGINGLFLRLYDAFYKKDPSICDKIEQEYEILLAKCEENLSSSPQDPLILSKCAEIIRLIHINNTITFGLTDLPDGSV